MVPKTCKSATQKWREEKQFLYDWEYWPKWLTAEYCVDCREFIKDYGFDLDVGEWVCKKCFFERWPRIVAAWRIGKEYINNFCGEKPICNYCEKVITDKYAFPDEEEEYIDQRGDTQYCKKYCCIDCYCR